MKPLLLIGVLMAATPASACFTDYVTGRVDCGSSGGGFVNHSQPNRAEQPQVYRGTDSYGRPVYTPPNVVITPNAYGLGTHSDQYGAPIGCTNVGGVISCN